MRLAELHLHLYGTIRPSAFLDWVSSRDVDWSYYESGFERAYGSLPPVRSLVERHRDGDHTARGAFDDLFVFGDEDGGNFERFQAKFNMLIAGSEMVRLHRHDDPVGALEGELEFFVRHMLDDQRRSGVGYAEQRMLLGNQFPRKLTLAALEQILKIYREEDSPELAPRLAIGCDRSDPWPAWELTKELALGPNGDLVTGVDFCNVEEGFPPRDKAEFFGDVLDWNDRNPERAIAILYHVGESFGDKSLESAVRWVEEAAELGAHRLGHAIALAVDPECYGAHTRSESVAERRDQIAYDLTHADALERRGVRVDRAALAQERRAIADRASSDTLDHAYDRARLDDVRKRQELAMERVRRTGAVVEVCPTSNRRIGAIADAAHHPVHRFLDHQVPFVVSTDDPGLFGTGPREELEWVAEHAGLEPGAVEELVARAWRYRSEVMTGRVRA